MTNDKPASDGGADDHARLLKQLEASVEASKNFSANVSQLAAAFFEGVDVKPKKKSIWHRFRSAITGLFVSKKYAEANPDTTVREKAD